MVRINKGISSAAMNATIDKMAKEMVRCEQCTYWRSIEGREKDIVYCKFYKLQFENIIRLAIDYGTGECRNFQENIEKKIMEKSW